MSNHFAFLAAATLSVALLGARPALAVCLPDDPFCGDTCTTDSECGPAEICALNACVPGCRADFDCASDEVCEVDACVPAPLTPAEQVEAACPCEDDWDNHGHYVRCVVAEVDTLALDKAVADEIIGNSARSTCGQ